jgi:hypothetical protein
MKRPVTDKYLATIDTAIVGTGKLFWRPQLHPSTSTVTAEMVSYFGLVHSFFDVLLPTSEKLTFSRVPVSSSWRAIGEVFKKESVTPNPTRDKPTWCAQDTKRCKEAACKETGSVAVYI